MMKAFGLPVALFLANVLIFARGQFVCDSTVTEREGNLTSPTYTRSMNYTVCVVAPSGYFSDISVTLNISDSVNCNETRLNIYERPSNKTFTYKTSLCGEDDVHYVGLGWAVQLVTSNSAPFVPSYGFNVAWITVKTHECTHENVIDQSPSGVVTSENYPERYFDNQRCLYAIQTPLENYTLWLNVTHFSLENSVDCLSDYVLIYSSAINKGERICGAKIPGLIKSPSNRLTVEFHTDSHQGSSGFRAVYFSASEFNFTAISGTVMSLGYPVANLGTQSYFYVTPARGKYTAFETHFIHVPSAGQTDCRNSNVFRIYSLIGEYQLGVCGMWNNTGVRLHQGVMVLLRTDVNLRTAAGIGFRSTYRTIDTDVCVEDYVLTEKLSWFTSPNFPLKYYNDKTCRYRIEAPRDHYVTLEFTTFYVEGFGCHYDHVKIYDGNATDSPLLITLCGFNSTLPPVISSDNAMLVVFYTDYAYGYPGFNATYHSDPKASTATTTTTTETTMTTRTTTTTTTPATTITTPATTITTPETNTEITRSVARSGAKSNLFTGVHITPSILQQKLPDFDTQSRVSNKTLRGLNLKKKEKLKIRHEAFVEKIKTIQTEKKTAAAKRRRRKTPVVGDMSGLSDSLPTLEFLMREMEEKEHKKAPTKARSVLKERERMKRGRADMATFHQVLSHAAYKSDPGATIREHLANKMKLEQNP